MNFWIDLLHYDFLQMALVASLVLSLGCALISPLIVGQGLSFMGPALSHSTLLASALAYLSVGSDSWALLYVMTLVFMAAFAFILSFMTLKSNTPRDAMIGIFLAMSMALGLIIQKKILSGVSDLTTLLIGDLLLVTKEDLLALILVVFLWALLFLPRWRLWIYHAFDPEGAALALLPTKIMHVIFHLMVAAFVVSIVKLAGILTIEGLLLISGLTSLRLARSMKSALRTSVIIALLASPVAMYFSYELDLPAGPCLVLFQFFFAGMILLAKQR